MLHLRQLVFPFAGELGLGQLFHAQAAQQRHELEGLGRGDQLAAFAQHVFLGNQPFNDAGAGGGRAQTFFLHRFAQLVVFHRFAGAFHGAQKRGFRVARGRAGLQRFGLDRLGVDQFTRFDRHQVARALVVPVLDLFGRFLAVNGQPAGLDQHLALGLEVVFQIWRAVGLLHARRGGHHGNARGDLVFGTREEHRHEAAHHQVINLLFGFREAAGGLQRRDDGKVIADLGIVKNALRWPDVVALQRGAGVRCQMLHAAAGQHLEGLLDHRHIVLGQRA